MDHDPETRPRCGVAAPNRRITCDRLAGHDGLHETMGGAKRWESSPPGLFKFRHVNGYTQRGDQMPVPTRDIQVTCTCCGDSIASTWARVAAFVMDHVECDSREREARQAIKEGL